MTANSIRAAGQSHSMATELLSDKHIKLFLPYGWSFLNISGAATTLVKTGAGRLARIIHNKAVAAGVITLYDSLTASGTKIGTITLPAVLLNSQNAYEYDLQFTTGLTIVTSAADDLTVLYL
jgi:hypothetical protein